MKNQTRRALSFIASACLVATSLSAFGVSAEEEVVVTEAPVVTTEAVKTTTEAKATTTVKTTTTTKATTTEAKSTTTEAEKEVADTVAETTKAIAVVQEGEDDTTVATTTVTSGANGVTTTTADGTVVTTTISGEATTTTTGAVTTTAGSSTTTTSGSASAVSTVTQPTLADDTNDATVTTTKATVTTVIDGVEVTTAYEEVTEATTEALKEYTHTNDVILTIDTSGSMQGEPIELVRQTAIDLVTKILAEDPDAQISLVEFQDNAGHSYFYDEEGNVINYTNDPDVLIELINNIIDGQVNRDDYDVNGTTNFLSAFEQIKLVMDSGTGEEKSIVIMSDGADNGPDGSYSGETSGDPENPDDPFFKHLNYLYSEYDGEYDEEYGLYEGTNGLYDFVDEYIKPFATIYTIGYYQNMEENSEGIEQSRDLLQNLASEPDDCATYYEANEKNIDEITDLITQDIVYGCPPEGKKPEDNKEETNEDKDANSPKTGDSGVASVVLLGGLACALVVTTKKKKD